MAGKSTINRLEYCPETIINQKSSRYHKIEPEPKEIEKAFVEIFLADYKKPPREIVLDMDVTDDQVHGNQEGAFFNPYCKGICYAPLYIFCGHHLLVAKLRSSNVDPAEGSQLKLRASDIIEKAKADYQQRLKPVTELMETFFAPDEELEEVKKIVPESTWYRSLYYKTQKSWSRFRRVVTKVCR